MPHDLPKFFHRSSTVLDLGAKLTGRGLPNNSAAIEAAFEARRPAACLSRLHAVFMTTNPDLSLDGIHGGHVYRVEALGPVEMRDNTWYGEVQKAELKLKYRGTSTERLIYHYPDWSDDLLEQCADGYWSGRPLRSPNWEHLTLCAKVVELIGALSKA